MTRVPVPETADTTDPDIPPAAGFRTTLRARDAAVIAAIALFSVLFFVDRYRGTTPYVFLDGDAANIASFAAALDHPESFNGDMALGDPGHFKFYRTIHIPWLRGFVDLFGDYGTTFIVLLPIHVFLFCLGFYILGRVLFNNRYWALLLAIINTGLVWVGFGTYWGLYMDPQPRFTFQTFLPYLLAATLHWRSEPRRWPLLMIGAGLLMYVHSVGTSAWALAIWLSLAFARPAGYSRWRHGFYMVALGFVFLLTAAPFLINYLFNHAHGEAQGVDYHAITALMQQWYGLDYLNIPNGLRRFTLRWLWFRALFWVFAAVGVAFLLFHYRVRWPRVGMVIHWVSGIALVSIIVPFVEQEICRALEILPFEIDLSRNIRFLVPLMLLFCLWTLVAAEDRWVRGPAKRLAVRGVGAFLVAAWLAWHPPLRLGPWLDCWRGGQALCRPDGWSEQLEALDTVRTRTPPGSRILPQELALELRYYALRPVVYARKDKGVLSYTDHAAFLEWNELYERTNRIGELDHPDQRFAAWRALGVELGADYLLLKSTDLPLAEQDPVWQLIWQNPRLALIQLSPPSSGS